VQIEIAPAVHFHYIVEVHCEDDLWKVASDFLKQLRQIDRYEVIIGRVDISLNSESRADSQFNRGP